MEDYLELVKKLLLQGRSNDHIKEKLLDLGLNDYQAFLTYQGGKILAETYVSARSHATLRELRLSLPTPQEFVPFIPPPIHKVIS